MTDKLETAIRDALFDLHDAGWGSALACLPAGGVECEALVERAVDRLREAIGEKRLFENSPASTVLMKIDTSQQEK